MGPCEFCKKMIYLEWIAERGYHRDCYDKYMKAQTNKQVEFDTCVSRLVTADKREKKRRLSRARSKKLKSQGV